ncbi:MAG: NfeD family protein [Eikenella sp.]|nr:NfeD family protein [Eikenella sp.]
MMYWLIAAAALFVLEMFVGTVYLLVVAASLLGAALAAGLFGAGWQVALSVAVLLSALGIFCVYRWRKTRRRSPAEKNDDDLDIGHTVILQAQQADGLWLVHYRGAPWQARADFPARAGQTARIAGKNGNVLILTPQEN